ncbi:MAG: exodeoxyribonuclease VII large subunit [Propionibacteriaceae bacterium]|jgi:exodeoxyribonuclease VII large subunit|nr:exodeoxyribonuclease VII large subunit [Propionibacteriaceae bacterium]
MNSSPEAPQPLHVIVDATKGWVERLGAVWVAGQVIELRRRAGHRQYLTLRDAAEEVSVQVATTATVLDSAGPVAEGATVAALLKPVVWRNSTKLVFECNDLRLAGEGRLLAALEQRKRMLQAEGLFDPSLKKRLPFLPKKIGLVTGAKSAAERDVIENAQKRWPQVRFEVRNTLVQGAQAAEQIATALHELDALAEVEVIVIARGGGSLEDLLPFSDEALVRAVFACRTPVVSAIGHEIDNPILDLVADLRASTPTDAARRVVPDAAELLAAHGQARQRLRGAVSSRILREQRWLVDVRSRPVMRNPGESVRLNQERVAVLRRRLNSALLRKTQVAVSDIAGLRGRVRALSPQRTLGRGYAILSAGGQTITEKTQVTAGDKLAAQLRDGQIEVQVLGDTTDVVAKESAAKADPPPKKPRQGRAQPSTKSRVKPVGEPLSKE